jgi:hypothetical protein
VDADLSVQVAVIGAVAALFGAALGAVVQGWSEWQRRRMEARQASRLRRREWQTHKRATYSELLTAMNAYRAATSRYDQAVQAAWGPAEPVEDDEVQAAQLTYVMSLGAAALVTEGGGLRDDLVKAAVDTESLQWSPELLNRLIEEIGDDESVTK